MGSKDCLLHQNVAVPERGDAEAIADAVAGAAASTVAYIALMAPSREIVVGLTL